jgi:uncharacterized membrane protein YiaA
LASSIWWRRRSISSLMWVVPCTAAFSAILLLTVGLWNATLAPSEKGFYAMSFVLSLFAVVAVQKNVRDLGGARPGEPKAAME